MPQGAQRGSLISRTDITTATLAGAFLENGMSVEIPLDRMTVAEKVQLLEAIWDSLCRQTGDVQSPDWHREDLDERRRRLESGQATIASWAADVGGCSQ